MSLINSANSVFRCCGTLGVAISFQPFGASVLLHHKMFQNGDPCRLVTS